MKTDGGSTLKSVLSFIDSSPSPYHAVQVTAARLKHAGFVAISETESWLGLLEVGGRYFLTRGGTSIVAFAIPSGIGCGPSPFAIIGAHTDSPCLKLKPVSTTNENHGYLQVGVECYGGGLWHTWFDRDLGLGGRVIVRLQNEQLSVRLVHIRRALLRIPNLAIHLSREVASDGFKVDRENHTVPVLGMTDLNQKLNSTGEKEDRYTIDSTDKSSAISRHPPMLLKVLAEELGVLPHEIVDLDLCLTDTQPAAVGGVNNEFIFAPRLDNLASCFTAVEALIRSVDDDVQCGSGVDPIRMIALFDHEEVGSSSAHGAGSPLVTDIMQRITQVIQVDYWASIRRSFLISADMAHAFHPNYPEKHEQRHRPKLGGGVVIKTNQNQRYATSCETGFITREIARRAGGIPVQEFVVANGAACGSTIGPILSSGTGMRTVDLGQPQLSMHSIREMCHVGDLEHTQRLFEGFFRYFVLIDEELSVSTEAAPRQTSK